MEVPEDMNSKRNRLSSANFSLVKLDLVEVPSFFSHSWLTLVVRHPGATVHIYKKKDAAGNEENEHLAKGNPQQADKADINAPLAVFGSK